MRVATTADEDACNALSRRVHGFDRAVELAQATSRGTARVVEQGGRVTGYSTHLAFFGHSTAETNLDMQALLVSVESFGGLEFLSPLATAFCCGGACRMDLRVVQPMTLMSSGLYNDPAGAWLPSVLF